MNTFISYRREDSQYVADRIHQSLAEVFGQETVFKDVDSIPLGVDFSQEIKSEVGKCDVLLAVIGPDWLTARKPDGTRRLDDPEDWVRVEIEAALGGKILVIPLMVEGAATLPRSDQLPPGGLAGLVTRNGTPAPPDPDFRNDMERLVTAIERARNATASSREGSI